MRNLITLMEAREELVQDALPYGREDLAPVMSKETLDYHFGKLAKGYVDRYNKGEGDDEFNKAGAFLHNIFFAQLKAPKASNRPTDSCLEFINRHFGSYEEFKEALGIEAMKIQGSGWVYLARNGSIKTIKNHQIKTDIVLLVDWWEHAWALDYQADKAGYLKNFWRLVDWEKINLRLG